jgi:DNA-binding beta-propeller fold protein YncE
MCSTISKAARFLLPVLLGALPGFPRAAEPPAPPLVLEQTIPLPNVSGRIDHLAVDLRRQQLFIAEIGNKTLDVIALAEGQVVHRITGLKGPQGVGYAPQADLFAVASGGDGTVRWFRGSDALPAGMALLGDDADDVRFDARTGAMLVGFGSGALATLDPASRAVTRLVKLAAHPEGFQADPASGRVFVNVPDAGQVAVVDLAAGRQVATWRVPGLRANFPMALDAGSNALAVVFRSPARLVLLDTRTGAVTENVATCGDADDAFFDGKRHRLYVSCGEGVVDVLQQSRRTYRPLARITTAPGARTSLFVPELDRLFVAAPADASGANAAILVFRPGP